MSDAALPTEVGVYIVIKGKLADVEPEIVGWLTGGVLKRMATLGLDHGHVNGKVMHSTREILIKFSTFHKYSS
jgi:hypothetical protein